DLQAAGGVAERAGAIDDLVGLQGRRSRAEVERGLRRQGEGGESPGEGERGRGEAGAEHGPLHEVASGGGGGGRVRGLAGLEEGRAGSLSYRNRQALALPGAAGDNSAIPSPWRTPGMRTSVACFALLLAVPPAQAAPAPMSRAVAETEVRLR